MQGAIQAVVRAGATYVESIEFQMAKNGQAQALAEARALAIAKARRLAARAAGVSWEPKALS